MQMGTTGNRLREIGRLGKPHGVHGEVNMIPVSPDLDRLLDLKNIFVGEQAESAFSVTVISARLHRAKKGPTLLLVLEGISDRDDVALQRGKLVFARDADLPALEDQEFYYTDIIGFEAVLETGEVLGLIQDVLDRPPQDLLILKTPDGQEVYIPLVSEFVRGVDQETKKITLSPIEGMIQQ